MADANGLTEVMGGVSGGDVEGTVPSVGSDDNVRGTVPLSVKEGMIEAMSQEPNTNVREWVSQLRSPDNRAAYCALKGLVEASGQSSAVYAYLDSFISMMRDSSSYVRTRGLTLIACNARWDAAGKIDRIIDEYLQHATDERPITARQCVKSLRQLAEAKPALVPRIADALRNADVSKYSDSMRPLVQKDIRETLLSLDGRR